MVAKAAGVAGLESMQEPWADWDVVMPDGTRLEVKCSAYIQDWDQDDYSRIVFSGLRAKELYYSEAVTPLAEIGDARYKADVYVLALQHHRDHGTFSVLDLAQWTFYVLTRDELDTCASGGKSVSLPTLVRHEVAGIPFSELRGALQAASVRSRPESVLTAGRDGAPRGQEWETLLKVPRARASEVRRSSVPDLPGVYAWFEGDGCVYVGKAGRLRSRIRSHLATSADLSRSTLRAWAAVYQLGVDRATARSRPPALTSEQVSIVNDWIAGLEVGWVLTGSSAAADGLERRLRAVWRPPLNAM